MNDKFNPEMLVMGREIRGLTQEELAGKCGISARVLAAIEDGWSLPGLLPGAVMIARFSEVLNFPIPFFYREGKRHKPEAWELMHYYGYTAEEAAKEISKCSD